MARTEVREVHFDQVNRDLRLPRGGGDYEIRRFPLPTSPVDTGETRVAPRRHESVTRIRRVVLARRILQALRSWRHRPLLAREGQVVILTTSLLSTFSLTVTMARLCPDRLRGEPARRLAFSVRELTSRRQS